MRIVQEEAEELAKVVHGVLGDEICDHYESTTGYTYCEDVAKSSMRAGWLSTEEHIELVKDSARHEGQTNASLRGRLAKSEAANKDLKEALAHTRDLWQATRRQRDNRAIRAKIAEDQVSRVEDLIAYASSRSGVVLIEDLTKALRQTSSEED